jgi:regulatory protein
VKPQRSLKARALQWLAQREQSRVELRRKLMPHAVAEAQAEAAKGEAGSAGSIAGVGCWDLPAPKEPPTDDLAASGPSPAARVEAVLDWLEAHKYLSSERFVESRVHARSSRFGNLRIRQELKQHQVALSPEAAQALAASELQRAREVRSRKFADLPATAAERAKQARFLAARGFSPEVIGRALRDSGRRDDDFEPDDASPD